jgi:phospholipid transport system substrate-binding protein
MSSMLRTTVMLLVLIVSSAAAAAQASPLAVVKKANVEVEQLVKRKLPKGSPQEKRVKDEIRAIVNSLLDFDELAREAMIRHWSEMSGAQRSEFAQTLRDLIERNYVKQIRGNADYSISYQGEKVTAERADVRTVIRAKRKGRIADTIVDYKLLLKSGKWRVYDVITDEDEYSGLVMNYRSEFNKIWNKEGYDGVMRKMRKKLKEIED